MANVLVQESSLTAIADAIRAKNGTEDTYKPADMASAIANIPSGGGEKPLSELQTAQISKYLGSDGTVDLSAYVDDFAKVKWILIYPGNGSTGITASYVCGFVWSSTMGTKYFIQIGGSKSGQISNNLGMSYRVADDGEQVTVGSFSTGPSCYLDVNGLAIKVLNVNDASWTGTVRVHIFYEE